MYKVVEVEGGAMVKPGQRILSFRNEIYEFTGFESPRQVGSGGRVHVKDLSTGVERAMYPSVFNLEIVEE